MRWALCGIVVAIFFTANARVPTPDNVDLALKIRPTLETLGAFEPQGQQLPVLSEYYVNLGGPEVIETGGRVWEACDIPTGNPCGYVTYVGGLYQNPGTILNTPADQAPLYATLLVDWTGTPEMVLDFPIVNGDYRVDLHFVEDFRTTGQREFHVDIEAARVLTDFDIYATAGALDTATVQSFFMSVTDGNLDVDFTNVTAQAMISAIAIYPQTVVGTQLVPIGYNDVMPQAPHVLPVLLPGAGDQCRAGYSCLTIPTTCDYSFSGAESQSAIETALNTAGNGYRYCVPIGADWRAYSIEPTRDCSSETDGRCWILPSDIETRALNAGLVSSPLLRRFAPANGAHGWAVVGMTFTNSATPQDGQLFGPDAGDTANSLLIAHSDLSSVGSATSSGAAAIAVRGDAWVVYSNRIQSSAVKAGVNFDGIGIYSGDTVFVHRNEIMDMAGRGIFVDGAVDSPYIINNDIRVTDALRAGSADTAPQGDGVYNCAGSLIQIDGGPALLADEGFIYGNSLHGARRANAGCGATLIGRTDAIALGDTADNYNLLFNLIFDSHSGIGGYDAGTGTGGSTVAANVIDLTAYGDGESGYEQFGLGAEDWGGDDQIYSGNLVLCRNTGDNGPWVWETGAADADLIGNAFVGCLKPGTVAETGSKVLSNVYVDNGLDSGVETPLIDDSGNRGTYTSMAFFAGICEFWPSGCPTIVFPQIVPPIGSDRAGLFDNPVYTTDRGASPPPGVWGEF